MPTRIVDDFELAAAIDVELFEHRSVAAAILFIVRDGTVDTVVVFIIGCGIAEPAAIRGVVFRNATFATAERRSEKRGAEEGQERLTP